MANTIELKQQIAQGLYDDAFRKLYGAEEKIVAAQRARYTELMASSRVYCCSSVR